MTPPNLLAFYKNETPLQIEFAGKRHVLPMSDVFEGKGSAGGAVPCREIETRFHLDECLNDYVMPVKRQIEKEGKFFDGTVVRICSHEKGRMQLQPASYYDGIATNFSMDYHPPERKMTLRQWIHGGRRCFVPFGSCRLVNHIGVVCMVETVDGMLLVQNRSQQVANRKNALTSSLSGAVDWDDIQGWRLFSLAGVGAAAIREGKEELGVDLERVVFLGMFREFVRGGKPEAYFYARTDEPFQTVLNRWKHDASDKSESAGLYGYELLSDRLIPDPASAKAFESRANGIWESVRDKADLTLKAGILLTGNYLLNRSASG